MLRASYLIIASVVCLVVALLSAVSVISTNTDAWFIGGMLAYVLSVVVSSLWTERPVARS